MSVPDVTASLMRRAWRGAGHLVLALGICLWLLPVAAQTNLVQLYQRAKVNDPVWATAVAARDAGMEYESIGLAGLLPSVSGTVENNRTELGRRALGVLAPQENFQYSATSYTLRLSQPLIDLARIAGYRQGVTQTQLAEISYAVSAQDLVLRVADAYFNYQLANDSRVLASAQKEAVLAQQEQAENLYKAGIATITDVEESMAKYQLAATQEAAAIFAVQVRQRELQRVVGALRPDELGDGVGKIVATLPEPDTVQKWADAAREQNLLVAGKRLQVEIAQYQADQQRAGHYPSAALVGSKFKTDRASFGIGNQDSYVVGVEVSIPIFEGGRVSASVRQAVANLEKTRQELESAVLDAELKASQVFFELIAGVSRISSYEQALKSSEVTLEGMEAGQRAGLRTNSDVLNALQQVYSVRRDLQRERYAYLMNRLQIKSAIGALAPEELGVTDKIIGR
jgi:outer membrane protein